MKNVRSVIAKNERLKIIERTTRGRRQKVKKGHVLTGGPAPYGYRLVKEDGHQTLAVDESAARVVREIFNWYTGPEGLSIRQIVKRLSDRAEPTPTDRRNKRRVKKKRGYGKWSGSTIEYILSNETYAGRWHYGKRNKNGKDGADHLIAVPVPAVISQATWERVELRRAQNKSNSRRNMKYEYLLRRRVTCGDCGAKMVAQVYQNGRYLYYRCPVRSDASTYYARECSLPHFRSDTVDAVAWEWVT